MFVTICLIISVLLLFYAYIVWNFRYWKDRGVPGPKPKPYCGTYPQSSLMKKNAIYDLEDIYKEYKCQTPYCGIFSGRMPQILALDREFIRDILIRNFKNFNCNELADMIDKTVDPIFARNPFMLKGEEWKEKRAEITPAFTTSRIKAMYPLVEDVCERMKNYIQNEINKNLGKGIDTKELSAKYTTDVVSSCIYGLDSKAFSKQPSIIREMGASLFKPNLKSFIYFLLVTVFPFLSKIYQLPFVTKKVEIFFTQLMNDAIRMRDESKLERDDYLNYLLLLRKRKNLSDIDMAAHTVSFFLDGFETSSAAITHMLYALAGHQNVQQKLRDEINETIKRNGKITYDNLLEMPYLEQIFNESLRLYPPLGLISKKCMEPIEVIGAKDKKLQIEKDMIVVIPIYSVHRDKEYYENPDEFIPERYDEENGGIKKYKDMGVWFPFGVGPRICLGMRFAGVQTKAAVVEIIRNFQVSVNKKTQEPFVFDPLQFILIPIGGIWLDFKPL